MNLIVQNVDLALYKSIFVFIIGKFEALIASIVLNLQNLLLQLLIEVLNNLIELVKLFNLLCLLYQLNFEILFVFFNSFNFAFELVNGIIISNGLLLIFRDNVILLLSFLYSILYLLIQPFND